MEVQLRLPLHPDQLTVARDPARFKVLATGRRWGKSRLLARELLAESLAGGTVWWVFPTYQLGTPQWRLLKGLVRPIPGVRKLETERTLEFPNGGVLTFKSADRADTLRGDGLTGLAVDEAAFLRESAWTNELRPALSDRQGWAILASSPKGLANWFGQLYHRVPKLGPAWGRWVFPTSSNPYIHPDEIEDARNGLPDIVFRQEYLGQFLESGTGLFTNIMAQAVAAGQQSRALDPDTGEDAEHSYVAGLDLARSQDFTVLTIMDLSLGVPAAVFIDRFNRMSWRQMIARVKDSVQLFKPETLVVDATGVGDPVAERLMEEVGDVTTVVPFTISQASKPSLVEDLALAIEHGELQYIPDPDLIQELMAMEMTPTKMGRTKYEAPSGAHDDLVMSLALAWYGARAGHLALGIL